MSMKALHTGDNPVKVTGSMMQNLVKFNAREDKIAQLDAQISEFENNLKNLETQKSELLPQTTNEDRKTAKEATKDIKGIDKEMSNIEHQKSKADSEREKLTNERTSVLGGLNVSLVANEDKENDANALSAELNDVSFDVNQMPVMPEATEPTSEAMPVMPEATEPTSEAMPVMPESTEPAPEAMPVMPEATEPAPEAMPVMPEATEPAPEAMPVMPEATEAMPVMPEATEPAPEAMPVMPETEESAPEVTVAPKTEENKPWDAIPEIPIVPIYDFDEKTEPKKESITPDTIKAIDDIINNANKKKEEVDIEPMPVAKEVKKQEEPKAEVKAEEPKKESAKEDIDDEMPEIKDITLKDYIKFPNYQAWLFTFAEDVYKKESFTTKDILALEKKEGFVSERRFNTGRAKQAIALTNENNKLIDKTREAIVARNASQILAKNLTDELNDTKMKLDDLTDKYENQSNKLADTEKELADTKDVLAQTKEELEKTQKELTTFQNTFNKMRGIIENNASGEGAAKKKTNN